MPIQANEVEPNMRLFKLPSCGLWYQGDYPGFPSEVTVMPYSFETEGILTSELPAFLKMAKIAGHCVENFPENFDFSDLLSGDMFAIIALARAMTYGEDYQFKATCPDCSESEIVSVKVPDEVPIISWEGKTLEELKELFTIKIPYQKDVIEFSPLTIKETLLVEKEKQRLIAVSKEDLGDLYFTAAQIKAVNGGSPESLSESLSYLRRLSGPDMVSVTDHLENLNCGIDLSYKMVCGNGKCKNQYEAQVPLGTDFFRRSSYADKLES